jgi:hypothetical protein
MVSQLSRVRLKEGAVLEISAVKDTPIGG